MIGSDFSIQIGSGFVFAILCAVLAAGRGRSPVGWFFIGLFLSCIGLILLLVLPDLSLEDAGARRQSAEVRRLREQLKKERHVSDERYRVHRARLEMHDRALGVDTSEGERRLLDEGLAPPPLTGPRADEPTATAATSPDTAWFHASGGEQNGPIPEAELRELLRRRDIDRTTLVWRQGMMDWQPAYEVAELRADIPD